MPSPSPAGWGSKHDIRVVETNYDEYALVATQISKSTGSSTMVLLYSKSLGPPCCPPHHHPGVPRDVPGGGSLPWEKRSIISQAGVIRGMAGSGPPCWAACTLGQHDPSLGGAGGLPLTLLSLQAGQRSSVLSAWRGSPSSPGSRA